MDNRYSNCNWGLDEIRLLIDLFDRGYTDKEIAEHLPRSRGAIERKRMDLSLLKGGNVYTDEVLLTKLEKFSFKFKEKYGRIPELKDIDEAEELPSGQTYIRRFDYLSSAYMKIGIQPNRFNTDKDLKIGMWNLCEKLGRLPKYEEIDDSSLTGASSTYYRRVANDGMERSLENVYKWTGVDKKYNKVVGT